MLCVIYLCYLCNLLCYLRLWLCGCIATREITVFKRVGTVKKDKENLLNRGQILSDVKLQLDCLPMQCYIPQNGILLYNLFLI